MNELVSKTSLVAEDRAISARLTIALIATLLAWLTLGLFEREPWKADEAYTVGIVVSIVRHGHWLIPTLAGEPFMEKPPLVFWLAAASAKLFAPPLSLHVAARGANIVCVLTTFWLVWRTEREGSGRLSSWQAVLLLMISPAFLFATRYLTADLGLLPAAALGCLGLVYLTHQRRGAGWILGAAAGIGLMAKGLLMPGVLGIATLLSWLVSGPRSARWIGREAIEALLAFAVTGLTWPLLLYLHSPELFHVWLLDNNVARFVGGTDLGPANDRLETLGTLAALMLPAWPLALLSLYWHRRGLRRFAMTGPALFGGVWLLVVMTSATARGVYALPALVPLCIVAATALPLLGRLFGHGATVREPGPAGRHVPRYGDDSRLTRVLRLALPITAATLMVVALISLFAWPWPSHPPSPPLLAVTAVVALAWLVALWRSPRAGGLQSAFGLATLIFAAALTVFLPAADRRTGFKHLFDALAINVPAGHGCISSYALGESERGMLDYYTGIETLRDEVDPNRSRECALHIEQQRDPNQPAGFNCPGMSVVWQGYRDGHPNEAFRLCARKRP